MTPNSSLDPKINNNAHAVSPDWYEMRARWLALAKNALYRRQKYGDTPKGREAVKEAQFAYRMAEAAKFEIDNARSLRDWGVRLNGGN